MAAPKNILDDPKRLKELEKVSQDISFIHPAEDNALGFGARCFISGSLPYSKPKDSQLENGVWLRTNGQYTFFIQADPFAGFPHGRYPRLFLIWLTSEVVRTKDRRISAGNSFRGFMKQLGIPYGGGPRGSGTLLMKQIESLLSSRFGYRYTNQDANGGQESRKFLQPTDEYHMFWNERDKHEEQLNLFESYITLSEPFYNELIEHHVPLDMRAIKALQKSSLALDIYQWLAQRMYVLDQSGQPAYISWKALNLQFGSNYRYPSQFRDYFLRELPAVKLLYPEARINAEDKKVLKLYPSPPPVPVKWKSL